MHKTPDNCERFLTVNNWAEFQHYKHRNPPWIKLHRDLLRDYKFLCLQDASKLHLMLIWLLASQMDNKIPYDADFIKKQVSVSGDIDLNALINNGFLTVASAPLADCKQSAIAETETETETEAYSKETETEAETEAEALAEVAYVKLGKELTEIAFLPKNSPYAIVENWLEAGISGKLIKDVVTRVSKKQRVQAKIIKSLKYFENAIFKAHRASLGLINGQTEKETAAEKIERIGREHCQNKT